jgi:protein TonB
MVFLVTVGLHALFIAVLMTMKMGVPDFIQQSALVAEFLTPDKPIEQPPPQLTPETTEQPTWRLPEIPAPDFAPPADEPGPTALQLSPDPGPVAGPLEGTPAGSVPQIPSTPLQFSIVRSTDDYYPSQSLSLQEQGTAIVRVCVTPGGKLDGRPVIEGTSGSPRLDAAAISWAREALRFKPATRDGVAVAACKGFRVNFQLH